jgi:curved DNA-binding protein CbpA
MKNYYAILGVARDSSIRQIKQIYKKLAKEWHPDLHPKDPGCRTKIQEINEAYEVLSDPEKRHTYDRRIEEKRVSGIQTSRIHPDDSEDPFLSYFSRMNEILRKRTRK